MRRPAVTRLALVLGVQGMLAAGTAGGESPEAAARPTCSQGHVEVAVSLRYDDRTLGDVAGLFLQIDYPDAVALPGKGTDQSVRARITSLLEPRCRLVPVNEDTDADGREDRIRILLVSTTKDPLPSAPVARIRFDCAAEPPPAAFRCATGQVADSAGQLMRATEARQVTCAVAFAAGPASPAASP